MAIRRSGNHEVTLAAVCMRGSHDYDANLSTYKRFIEEAALRQVDLLVFPEASLHGYIVGAAAQGTEEWGDQYRYFRQVAEPVPGPSTEVLQRYAARHNMLIQVGMAERALNGDVIYNSAVLVGPEGVIGVFRKAHNQFEWPVFRPGEHLSVMPTRLGRIGMFICYDLCFPEVVRSFALQGATIASLSTAWPMKGEDPATDYWGYIYDLLSRANAVSNQIWLISANQVHRPPVPGSFDYYGHSRIVAPTGQIIAEIGHEEGLVSATVDINEGIEQARTFDVFGNNLLADRRPDLYGLLADQRIYYQTAVDPLQRQPYPRQAPKDDADELLSPTPQADLRSVN